MGKNNKISRKNIFVIASTTKPITSVDALLLVDQGKITLDDPLNRYFPGMASTPISNKKTKLLNLVIVFFLGIFLLILQVLVINSLVRNSEGGMS